MIRHEVCLLEMSDGWSPRGRGIFWEDVEREPSEIEKFAPDSRGEAMVSGEMKLGVFRMREMVGQ